jgi:DNA-binding response OmpR family regulator
MKVLVADDDEVVRVFVQRVAEHEGYDVLVAENGRAALTAVESEDPDLLITDLRMPELDGFGLIEQVRARPRHRRLPVICLSSVNQRADIETLIRAGISDYVLKPVKAGDLADRLRVVTRRERYWKAQRDRHDR